MLLKHTETCEKTNVVFTCARTKQKGLYPIKKLYLSKSGGNIKIFVLKFLKLFQELKYISAFIILRSAKAYASRPKS